MVKTRPQAPTHPYDVFVTWMAGIFKEKGYKVNQALYTKLHKELRA